MAAAVDQAVPSVEDTSLAISARRIQINKSERKAIECTSFANDTGSVVVAPNHLSLIQRI